jgi:hypothetical protein
MSDFLFKVLLYVVGTFQLTIFTLVIAQFVDMDSDTIFVFAVAFILDILAALKAEVMHNDY